MFDRINCLDLNIFLENYIFSEMNKPFPQQKDKVKWVFTSRYNYFNLHAILSSEITKAIFHKLFVFSQFKQFLFIIMMTTYQI